MDDCVYIRIETASRYGIAANYCIVVLMKSSWGRTVSSNFSTNFSAMRELLFISFIIVFLTFGLVLLYWRSRAFRFYMKYVAYNCSIMLTAIFALSIGVFHPFDVENFHRARGFVYCFLVKVFSIRVDIEGLETFNTLNGKNFIIVANHQSSLDMFPILKATPQRTSFLAKRELILAPLFGAAAWLYGVIFINRGNAKSARDVMARTAQEVVDKKINLWIFPEGTRSQTGTLLPFKKGAFHLAQQAQLPIVPLVLYDYSSIFNKMSKTFTTGIIRGKVLSPISTEGLAINDISELTERVREKMLKVFHESDYLNGTSADDKKTN
ncbi:1-acyl-sn-glycerol-3-phosphate acyltransferase alpha-like isoform X1 [Montipora capricornis]|uniref:1-acyl-sn-glycerol-3-phosphate acyltransferase alpha-like isoform X1 n=1 Tax=Montipora capricornis TaxID=246305 RepID=UPI0035F1EE4C